MEETGAFPEGKPSFPPVSSLSTDLFDYPLPEHLIAQTPAARRDQSRLMVVNRVTREIEHTVFAALPRFLGPHDLLIRNNAAVLPARLHARRATGGHVECLLLRPDTSDVEGGETWWCLVRPGRRLPVGSTFGLENTFTGTVLAKEDDGTTRVRFATPAGRSITDIANIVGEMPLPPYIERKAASDSQRATDLERYQTVYANRSRQVAVAAPTAGLHFTPELLAQLAHQEVSFADVTLHVGLGTFRPITSDTIGGHTIHREVYELPPATRAALHTTGKRRIAVGTTSVRAVEDYLRRSLPAAETPFAAEAALFIHPPDRFLGVDALITNFHQPRSTLLCLVSAFLAPGSTDGIAWLKELYAEAVAKEYRFFSYGDAMLIV